MARKATQLGPFQAHVHCFARVDVFGIVSGWIFFWRELSPTLTGETCPWLCCCLDRCFCKENNCSLFPRLKPCNTKVVAEGARKDYYTDNAWEGWGFDRLTSQKGGEFVCLFPRWSVTCVSRFHFDLFLTRTNEYKKANRHTRLYDKYVYCSASTLKGENVFSEVLWISLWFLNLPYMVLKKVLLIQLICTFHTLSKVSLQGS